MPGTPGHSVVYICLRLKCSLLPDCLAAMCTGPSHHVQGLGLEILQGDIGVLKKKKGNAAWFMFFDLTLLCPEAWVTPQPCKVPTTGPLCCLALS